MYKKIFKCRLCKKIVVEKLSQEPYIDIQIKMLNECEFKENRIHICNDNNMGILEFMGIENYGKSQKEC